MSVLKIAALAAALSLVGAPSAFAVTTEHGSRTVAKDPVDPANPTLNSWTLGNASFVGVGGSEAGTKNDLFDDSFTFTLGGTDSVDFGVSTRFNHGPEVSFSGWSLFDVTTHTTIDGAGSLLTNAIQVDDLILAPGTYTLEFFGKFVQKKGLYDGYVTATAVPEPAEWALMLGGLGLVGAFARRRARG